jgi:hypothetical protein
MTKSHIIPFLLLIVYSCNLERIEEGTPTCAAKKFKTTTLATLTGVLTTDDCGYVACGDSRTFGSGSQSYLSKFDENGELKWERDYGTTRDEYIKSVVQTKDNGYLLCGSTSGFNTGFHTDAYLIKTDANGIESWKRNFKSAGFSLNGVGIAQFADGGYLCAYIKSDTTQFLPSQIGLLKVKTNGDEEWTKVISLTQSLYINDLKPTLDGGFILCGSASEQGTQTYILKLDASGNKDWEEKYSNPLSTYLPGYAVVATSTGYAVASSLLGTNDHDVNILFYGLDHKLKWEKTFGGVAADEAIGIAVGKDGNIAAIGYSNSFGTNKQIYFLRLNISNGATLTEKRFDSDGYSNYAAIKNTSDGGYIFTFGSNLYKVDVNGNFQ